MEWYMFEWFFFQVWNPTLRYFKKQQNFRARDKFSFRSQLSVQLINTNISAYWPSHMLHCILSYRYHHIELMLLFVEYICTKNNFCSKYINWPWLVLYSVWIILDGRQSHTKKIFCWFISLVLCQGAVFVYYIFTSW